MAFIAITDGHPDLKAQLMGYRADAAINPEVFVAGLNDETRQLALRWAISKQAVGLESPHIVKLTTALLSRPDVVIGAEVRALIKFRLICPIVRVLSGFGTPAMRACAVRANEVAFNALDIVAGEAMSDDRTLHFVHSCMSNFLPVAAVNMAQLAAHEQAACQGLLALDPHLGASFIGALEERIPGEVSDAARAKLAALDA